MTKRELIALCESFKQNETEKFYQIVRGFISLNPENAKKLCVEFSLSFPTLHRWVRNKNAANEFMRSPIVNWIKSLFS